jgi:hypothetical protein
VKSNDATSFDRLRTWNGEQSRAFEEVAFQLLKRQVPARARRKKDPELRRLDQASARASKQLAVQIRAELDVARHGRRQQRRQGHSQDRLPAISTSNLAGKLPPSGPESTTKSLPETLPGQLR